MTGIVERMDDNEVVDLKGYLIDGIETGLFEEMTGGKVVWRGYYRNGERYSEVVKSRRGGRWYVERRVGSGEVLSIAEYDEGLHDKNGMCWEYENGKWVGEWVYENGVRVRCVREDRDGMMVAYDESGEKRVMEMNEWDGMRTRERLDTVMKEKNNDSMMEYDIETGREHGVWKKEEKCYVIKRGDEENRVVVADLKTHEMRVYDGDDWKENKQDGVDCIDLDVNGKRWEGGVKNGKPFGYGELYDEEGKKEYEGFMVDGVKNCKGIEYYSDIGKVEYKGSFCDDKRFGRGVLYDRNGIIEYNGLWKNDEPYSPHSNDSTIDNHTETVTISNGLFNNREPFIPSFYMQSLKRIVIGDRCFGKVRVFELDGLDELESVEIGQDSFRISDKERNDGSCQIVNCPKLKSIQIGDGSFQDYHSFELNNLPSLQSIFISDWCFEYAQSFSLTDLSQLQSLTLGYSAFKRVQSIVFENLPKLQSIQLGSGALDGDKRDDRTTISDEPYNFKNTLTMRNLPSLTEFKGYDCNFKYIGSVILENIPQLTSDGIYIGGYCFRYTYFLQSSNASALENCISFGDKSPSSTSYVIRNRIMLESIPLDVEDLWIGCFDTSGLTEFSFDTYLSLKSLVLGSNAFCYVTQFELNGLPSLQSIIFGKYSTCYTPSLSLTNLPQLQSIKFGYKSFNRVHTVVFENLPKLQSIQLSRCALFGDGRADRETIRNPPFNYRNTLTMRNLPSLTEFEGDDYNFKYIGSVILENIPQLSSDGIYFGGYCFRYTYSLQSSNAAALDSAIRSKSKYV
ncbi:hypothetical protein WA538_003322 [Blastocystis sp. DL]